MRFVIESDSCRALWEGDAETLKLAVEKANLGGANLAWANLAGANLIGANLRRAHLEGAHLEGANLRRANLAGANLIGAHLEGANLAGANLEAIRRDVLAVLDAAPNEVYGLRDALARGNVDGSAYRGECACLVGTIANVRGCALDDLAGLRPDADRPAERWFLAIRPGDNRRSSQVVAITLGWIDEWLKEHDVAIPKRTKSEAEVGRLMRGMTKTQRLAVLQFAKGGAR